MSLSLKMVAEFVTATQRVAAIPKCSGDDRAEVPPMREMGRYTGWCPAGSSIQVRGGRGEGGTMPGGLCERSGPGSPLMATFDTNC